MAITNTFRELAVDLSKTQQKMVDTVLNEAPILAGLPMEAATHGLQNVYEEVVGADSAQAVDLDEALPEVDASSKLKTTDLKVLGAKITVGEDKARQYGSAGAYFNKKYPTILKATGQDMEKALIYGTFRKYAIDNHTSGDPRVIKAGGVTAGVNYSIVVVHFAPGEITGLYDPQGFGSGKAFDIKAVSGGDLYEDRNGRMVYGVRLKTYFGVQLANPRYVSTIVNIDLTSATKFAPTAAMMDDAIVNARGRPENTLIFMHPKVKAALQDLKGGYMEMTPSDKNVDRRFMTWGGVEIVDSYNFLMGTEALVS